MTAACTRVVAMVMKRDQIPAIFKIQPSGFAKRLNVRYVLREQDSRIIPKYSDLSNYNNGITDTEDYFKNIQTIIDYLIFTQKDSISITWELVTNAGYLRHHSRPSE